MKTILFISGESRNDALGAAGRAHRPMFEGLGYELIEVNFATSEAQEQLNQAIRAGSIEFAFGVMGMGADIGGITSDGKESNLWEGIHVPFISLFGDTPAYFFDRHVIPNAWHAALYFYPEHYDLRMRLPRSNAGIYGLVPPIPFNSIEKRDVDFRQKERGKLIFLKNGNDPAKLVQFWRNVMPPDAFVTIADMAGNLADHVASDMGYDIDALVTQTFMDKGWDISEFLNLRLFFVAQLDDYLRRIKSTMMGKVLAEFPVEIRGFNWEHVDFSRGQARYAPGLDYAETRKEILGSLGIVDMSPNTQRAPHDRPMRAFGLYTFCLTNHQKFFSDGYENSSQFSFRFQEDDLRDRVADVLAHPKQYVELGVDVAEQYRKRHKPEDFGSYMIETAGHIRLGCGPRPQGIQDYFVWPPTKVGASCD
jgi:hypothetical protein